MTLSAISKTKESSFRCWRVPNVHPKILEIAKKWIQKIRMHIILSFMSLAIKSQDAFGIEIWTKIWLSGWEIEIWSHRKNIYCRRHVLSSRNSNDRRVDNQNHTWKSDYSCLCLCCESDYCINGWYGCDNGIVKHFITIITTPIWSPGRPHF